MGEPVEIFEICCGCKKKDMYFITGYRFENL